MPALRGRRVRSVFRGGGSASRSTSCGPQGLSPASYGRTPPFSAADSPSASPPRPGCVQPGAGESRRIASLALANTCAAGNLELMRRKS